MVISEQSSDGGLRDAHCFALRPFLGNILASKPSRKIPTRMAISVISTVELLISIRILSTREKLSARMNPRVES